MIDLYKVVLDKYAWLDTQLTEAKFVRDHSATPTESASDKTRQNAEQLMDSLNDAKKKLKLIEHDLNKIPKFNNLATVNTFILLSTPLGDKNFLLVPNGLGGQTIENTILLSVNSPLAQSFIGRKVGFTFIFNGGQYRVVLISPNI